MARFERIISNNSNVVKTSEDGDAMIESMEIFF